ncbi:MAG: hypothetical protein K6E59_02535 [Bacilli bacterium]|nr:hypothetical protein [Bacilli bacterium]
MTGEEEVAQTPQEPGYLQAQKVEINYKTARFHRRIFANLVDFIVFAVVFIGLFALIRAIIVSTPDYKAKEDELISIRLDSGMYRKNANGKIMDTVSFLAASENNFTGYAKMVESRESVDKFIAYVGTVSGDSARITVQNDYDDYRLKPTLVYEGVPYFVVSEGNIVRNDACKANAETYFNNAYAPYIDEHCQGYLITLVPRYLELTRYESTTLIAGELLPAYLVAPFFSHLLPMMIFRRGRMSWGKALYRVGVVDNRLLVPTVSRTLARFAIFYFAEALLSPFTFAIPLIVSTSLMAWSKAHQSFPDYLLGLHEVDVSDDKIYFSREEILTSGMAGNRKPVDFKNTYED